MSKSPSSHPLSPARPVDVLVDVHLCKTLKNIARQCQAVSSTYKIFKNKKKGTTHPVGTSADSAQVGNPSSTTFNDFCNNYGNLRQSVLLVDTCAEVGDHLVCIGVPQFVDPGTVSPKNTMI